MLKLCVCVPTNRPLEVAIGPISKLVSGLPADVDIVISDNSLADDKKEFLTRLATKHQNVACIFPERATTALENFRAVLSHADSDLVAFTADDDFLLPDSLLYSRDYFDKHPECAISSGAICDYRPSYGPKVIAGVDYDGPWSKRVMDYLIDRNLGGNFLFYGMYRRELVIRYFDYIDHHPLVSIFFDYHMPAMALAMGSGHIGKAGLYVYDNSNWEDYAACVLQRKKYYLTQGIPDWFAHFESYYRAVEFLLFFGGEFIDQPKEERLKLGLELCEKYLTMWLNSVPSFFESLPANVRKPLLAVLVKYNGKQVPIPDAITLFFELIEIAMPEKALQYKDFFGRNMGL
jgi:hypothetical protein